MVASSFVTEVRKALSIGEVALSSEDDQQPTSRITAHGITASRVNKVARQQSTRKSDQPRVLESKTILQPENGDEIARLAFGLVEGEI